MAGTRLAAAEEVLDALEPCMIAAQLDGARIPIGRLLQPYVCGYLIQCCGEALEVRNGKEPSHEQQTPVYQRLLRSPRLARLVSRELAAVGGPPQGCVIQASAHVTPSSLSAARSFDGG